MGYEHKYWERYEKYMTSGGQVKEFSLGSCIQFDYLILIHISDI